MNTQEIREKSRDLVDCSGWAVDTMRKLCDEIDQLQAEHGLTINKYQREYMDTGVFYRGERILLETGYQKFADRLGKFLRDKFKLV